MTDQLTHLDERGQAAMVDVADKAITSRRALARGEVRMNRATLGAIRDGDVPKVMCWLQRALPVSWQQNARPNSSRSAIRCC